MRENSVSRSVPEPIIGPQARRSAREKAISQMLWRQVGGNLGFSGAPVGAYQFITFLGAKDLEEVGDDEVKLKAKLLAKVHASQAGKHHLLAFAHLEDNSGATIGFPHNETRTFGATYMLIIQPTENTSDEKSS